MNKRQKQLINTYFRKRKMSVIENNEYLNNYENNYLTSIGEEPINLKYKLMSYITNPRKVPMGLVMGRGKNIVYLLNNNPELINYVNTVYMSGSDVKEVLILQPQLINKLPIHLLSDSDINEIIQYQPQLKSYFQERGI